MWDKLFLRMKIMATNCSFVNKKVLIMLAIFSASWSEIDYNSVNNNILPLYKVFYEGELIIVQIIRNYFVVPFRCLF